MRMVGNMSRSVDYRVITIIDAPGIEKRRVSIKKSDQHREKEQIYNNTTQGKKRKKHIQPMNSWQK